eukprot:gene20716-22749_t
MENNLTVAGAQFLKEFDNKQLLQKVKDLFPSILKDSDELEILMPVHFKLLPPNLPPGQLLNGFMVTKIFKDKPLYIRPSRQLIYDNATELTTRKRNFDADAMNIFDISDSNSETEDMPLFPPVASNASYLDQTDSATVQCPCCFFMYPNAQIEEHANDCIHTSKTVMAKSNAKPRSFTEAIKTEASEILKDDKAPLSITFTRRNVWTNAFTLFGDISQSDLHNGLRVTFVGEEAVDSGGPSRELFSMLWTEMSKCPLTEGTDNHLVFKHDVCRLAKKEFELFGTLVALFLIVVKQELNTLSKTADTESFNVALEALEYELEFAGYHNLSPKLSDKDSIIQHICQHYIINRCRNEIESFTTGLQFAGVLDICKMFPELCYNEKPVSDADVKSLFTPIFSAKGSNKRAKEEYLMFNWHNVLDKVERKRVICPKLFADEVDKLFTLEDIMQFATGSRGVPVIGYEHTGGRY